MKTSLPLTIDNGHGEVIIFKQIVPEPEGDKLILEGRVQPGCGPVMHVHHQQDEHFEVVKGTMIYQTPGQEPVTLQPGQSATFQRGQPHKFWNGGTEELVLDCWIQPANNAIFYLSTLYTATNGRSTPDPEPFTGAFLIQRYASEYNLLELPAFLHRAIIPIKESLSH